MLAIHGTPITPVALLEQMKGASFCVSYAAPQQLERVMGLQDPEGLLLLDNGAFSHWRAGQGKIDRASFFKWANEVQWCSEVAVAVIPDVIGGSEEENWMEAAHAVRGGYSDFPERLMFCWHMDDSMDQLFRAALLFNFVAIGSCAQYDVQTNRAGYLRRLQEAAAIFDYVEQFYGRRPWVHLMRGLAVAPEVLIFQSADSTNIARNHCRTKHQVGHVASMRKRIEGGIAAARRVAKPAREFPTTNFWPTSQQRALL